MSAIERHGVLAFAKMMAGLGDARLIHLEDAGDLRALARAYVELDAAVTHEHGPPPEWPESVPCRDCGGPTRFYCETPERVHYLCLACSTEDEWVPTSVWKTELS